MISFANALAKAGLRLGPLAQHEQLVKMVRRFRPGWASWDAAGAVTILFGLAVLGALAWLLQRLLNPRDRRGHNSPHRLFRELCKAHRLDRRNRRLLVQLAGWRQLEHPAMLFLDPQRFDAAPQQPVMGEGQGKLPALRDTLFGRQLGGTSAETSEDLGERRNR